METKGKNTDGLSLRYALLVPLSLMIASLVSCCFSYSTAKQNLKEDLNDAMVALANQNSQLWTRQDTITALRQMYAATHKPIIYQASDMSFRNAVLKDVAYFSLILVDKQNTTPKIHGNKIASDSIVLVPEKPVDGLAIQVQGFADCSMASVFVVSDQTLPGVFFALSILSMTSMLVWRRKVNEQTGPVIEDLSQPSIDRIKLTPMQRQLAQLLIDAPSMKVDKATLCLALWGNKSNAEESLYTLVKRTKTALASANIEIVCNRGESYELRIKA